MGMMDRLRKYFATTYEVKPTMPTDKVAATKTITNNLVGYLLGLSDFNNIDEDDIYEQLYKWEPEIGGAIDRMSTMVGEAYKHFYLIDAEDEMEEIERKMVDDANKIADEVDVRHYFEVFSELLEMHGNLFLEKKGDSVEILPNKYVTLIDSEERLTNPAGTNLPSTIMTSGDVLVLYEGMPGQRMLTKDQFIHIKYKNTPVFETDAKGRTTYGIYSVSPLHRVILSVWWKRQAMIIDIMWRLKNVPREHHKVSAEMFSLDKYAGDMSARNTAAQADMKAFIDTYVENINKQMPDQGYVTPDTVVIDIIENKSGQYMQTNELIDQLNSNIWAALNMPRSMIAGESDSSYASELVIANYVTQKVNQLTSKIRPIILELIRKRVKSMNSSYPVDRLDVLMQLDIDTTELEVFKQLAVMGELGVFTEDEIRERVHYKPLRDDQRAKLVKKEPASPFGGSDGGSSGTNPETPQSSVQHTTKGENSYRKIERKT